MKISVSPIYASLDELVNHEIRPALSQQSPDFDLGSLVRALRNAGLVFWVERRHPAPRSGYALVMDQDGNTPGFWDLVERVAGTSAPTAI